MQFRIEKQPTMTTYKIEFDFRNKMIEIESKFYRFEDGGRLTIIDGDLSTEGFYRIIQKGKRYFLVTEPEIIKGSKEIPIDLLLNNSIVFIND